MSAACTCPAGVGIHGFGNCNHVGGVLLGLEDLTHRGGLKDLPSFSCTSKLSSWNVPRDCSSNPVPTEEVVIKKIKFGSKSSTSEPKINVYDPRAECDCNVNIKQLKDTVALQMLYFLKIKIFISLDSCQFVEYLFKIKIYIFQFLNTKKGDNVSFVYFYKIITFV